MLACPGQGAFTRAGEPDHSSQSVGVMQPDAHSRGKALSVREALGNNVDYPGRGEEFLIVLEITNAFFGFSLVKSSAHNRFQVFSDHAGVAASLDRVSFVEAKELHRQISF